MAEPSKSTPVAKAAEKQKSKRIAVGVSEETSKAINKLRAQEMLATGADPSPNDIIVKALAALTAAQKK